MKKAVGYCRVSSRDQIKGTSLGSQVEQIEAYCKLHKFELVGIYTDAGVSGTMPLDKRPQGRLMVDALRSNQATDVVMTKIDRGFRSAGNCSTTVEAWLKAGINAHIMNIGMDTSTPMGRCVIQILASIGELERSMIEERNAEGREIRRLQGKRLGELPFGYTVAADKVLVTNNREQAAVDRIRELASTKVSFRSICRTLTTEGYQSRSGNWNHHTVKSILLRGI